MLRIKRRVKGEGFCPENMSSKILEKSRKHFSTNHHKFSIKIENDRSQLIFFVCKKRFKFSKGWKRKRLKINSIMSNSG